MSRTASFRVGFSLLLVARVVCAETADDFFHGGAMNYFSNNVPQALAVVTNGRAQFPDDEKLKKLEELLKQQQQQQQQDQQKQDQDKKEQDKKDQQQQDKKDQQQKDPQKKDGQDKHQKDQQKPQPDKQKSDQQKQQETKATPAGQMTPEQAKRLLDSQKGEESALVFRPPEKPKDESKPVKDW